MAIEGRSDLGRGGRSAVRTLRVPRASPPGLSIIKPGSSASTPSCPPRRPSTHSRNFLQFAASSLASSASVRVLGDGACKLRIVLQQAVGEARQGIHSRPAGAVRSASDPRGNPWTERTAFLCPNLDRGGPHGECLRDRHGEKTAERGHGPFPSQKARSAAWDRRRAPPPDDAAPLATGLRLIVAEQCWSRPVASARLGANFNRIRGQCQAPFGRV